MSAKYCPQVSCRQKTHKTHVTLTIELTHDLDNHKLLKVIRVHLVHARATFHPIKCSGS